MRIRLPERQLWSLLSTYLAPHRLRVTLLAGLLVTSIALSLVPPYALKLFIDSVKVGRDVLGLLAIAGLYCGANVAASAIGLVRECVSTQLAWTATNALREDLMAHCLRLDLQFHQRHSAGEMLERVDGDVLALGAFFSTFVGHLLGNGLLLAGVLFMLGLEDVRLALGFGVFSVATLWGLEKLRHRGQPAQEKFMQSLGRLMGCIEEQMTAAEDIRPLGALNFFLNQYSTRALVFYRRMLRAQLATNLMVNLALLASYAANACALAVGAYLYIKGDVTLGAVYASYAYVDMLRRPIDGLVDELGSLSRAGASAKRICSLTRTKPGVVDEGRGTLPDGSLGLSFEQVGLRYDSGIVALREVSFELCPGERLGLVGRTGSGKSTLVRLLYRFYDAKGGVIRVGGAPIPSTKLSELRSRIALLPQTPYLFDGSVFDNVTLLDRRISEQRVRVALQTVGLSEWLEKSQNGLSSRVGSGGEGLSAGEAQLLALARVFVSDAGLVIIDEPAALLDPKAERLFYKALEGLLSSRTAVIVTHRPEMLRMVDKVLVLEDGRVVQFSKRQCSMPNPLGVT